MLREAISPQTAAVAIAVIGLNIHFGFTGLLNMGQAGFMLLGAYGFAISIIELGRRMFRGGCCSGSGCAFVFALVLGAPTLKLRGDYLAIVTISAAEIIRYVGRPSHVRGLHRLAPRASPAASTAALPGPVVLRPDQIWTLQPVQLPRRRRRRRPRCAGSAGSVVHRADRGSRCC